MLTNGTISPEVHEAGCILRTQFPAALLDGMRTTQLIRMPKGASATLTDRQVAARDRIASAIEARGGPGSPGGSAVWHVLGLQCSIREWAMSQGWQGKPIAPAQAQGMFTAALSVLAVHYGLVRRRTLRGCAQTSPSVRGPAQTSRSRERAGQFRGCPAAQAA
jgi:hypothetical protein